MLLFRQVKKVYLKIIYLKMHQIYQINIRIKMEHGQEYMLDI